MELQKTGTRAVPARVPARLAAALAAVALVAAWRGGAPHAQVFRSGVDLASFGVAVVDKKGGLVTDLTRDDFEVREDGQLQTVTLFARGDAAAGLRWYAPRRRLTPHLDALVAGRGESLRVAASLLTAGNYYDYNDAVMAYNNSRETFPGMILAGGFPAAQSFAVEVPTEREPVKVSF